MAFDGNKYLAVGTRVRVTEAMAVPDWAVWDDDKGRISTLVKRRLQELFFKGHKRVTAEVLYVARESEREKLRRKGLIKVRLRDPSGAMLNMTANPDRLVKVA